MRKPRIYRGGEIGKNQTLLRYDEFGDVDFLVTITRDNVVCYIARTEGKTYSQAFREAAIIYSSDKGWGAIMDEDERFYEYLKSVHKGACRHLLTRRRSEIKRSWAVTWYNRRICIKEFVSSQKALRWFEKCPFPSSLSYFDGSKWSGMASKATETLIRAFRAEGTVNSPRALQIERERCRDGIPDCTSCPIKDCETMRKLKGERR